MIGLRMEGGGLEGMGEEMLSELRPWAERRVKDGAVMLEAEIKTTLSGQRTGKVYQPTRTGRPHVASAPGEAPARLFGRLFNSITHDPPKWTGNEVTSEVGTNVEYARRLEQGGRDSRGIYIAPRPYMEPSIRKAEPKWDAMLERE